MSAFFGVYSPSGSIDQLALDQMKSSIHRDGYDELNTYIDNQIVMGHLMLRFAPESAYDKQPLKSNCGRYILVGHFRLDYRDDLGDKLGLTQKELELTSDALLAMMSYEKWGDKCALHLEGDWAFVLYNTIDSSLFVARDKIGYSSLFYYQNDEQFFFASDLDTLVSGIDKLKIDKVQLYLMSLGRNYITKGRTVYKNVFFLHPGTTITINKQMCHKEKRIDAFAKNRYINFKYEYDYFIEFRSCFQVALKNKIYNKGNISIFLSGGLDSVLIAKYSDLLFRFNSQLQYSFTRSPLNVEKIGESKKDRDEFEVINQMKHHFLKTIFHSSTYMHVPVIDFFNKTDKVNSFNPILTANTYWIDGIMNDVRKSEIKLLLTGQFGNYTLSWDAPSINIIDSLISLIKTYQKVFTGQFFRRKSIFEIKRFLSIRERILVSWHLLNKQKVFFSSRGLRLYLISQNCFELGARHYQRGFDNAMLVVDPTADERFMKLSFSIPERLFNRNSVEKYMYKYSFLELLGKKFFTISTSNINQALHFRYKLESDLNILSHLENITKDYSDSRVMNIDLLKKCIQSHDGKKSLYFTSDLNAIEILRHISILHFYKKKVKFMV